MKWLNRCIWLAAWGVWIACGFGLYRGLPRELGPALYKLSLRPNEKVRGFLHGSPSIITREYGPAAGHAVFRRRNAANGDIELEVQGDGFDPRNWAYDVSIRHGLAIGHDQLPSVSNDVVGFAIQRAKQSGDVRVIDLRSGERCLFKGIGCLTGVHETRPWGLFCKYVDDGERVIILDLRTGSRILETKTPNSTVADGWLPHFIGGHHFGVFITSKDGSDLQIRSIATGNVVMMYDQRESSHPIGSSLGDIAWYERKKEVTGGLFVQRLATGEQSLVHKPPPHSWGLRKGAFFSEDGRTILSCSTGALIDLATNKPLWEGTGNDWSYTGYEKATSSLEPDRFFVEEKWQIRYESWSEFVKTYAVRSMKDGTLVFRTWDSMARDANEDYLLAYAKDGVRVHRLPPPVDWRLLTICQTVLATPLVLLWSLLKWRRRRAARRHARASADSHV